MAAQQELNREEVLRLAIGAGTQNYQAEMPAGKNISPSQLREQLNKDYLDRNQDGFTSHFLSVMMHSAD